MTSDAVLDLADFYHDMLWSYQKGITHTATINPKLASPKLMYPYLDEMIQHMPFARIIEGDPEKALRAYAETIMLYGFASKITVEPREDGYTFSIGHCIFSEQIHGKVEHIDVTCPWGIFAQYIAQKSSHKRVKATLSEFQARGSRTPIIYE